MIAVSDTGPLLYLSLIDCAGLLPQLFDRVLIPGAVAEELSDEGSPPEVAVILDDTHPWLEVRVISLLHPGLEKLGAGESEAITLAVNLSADVFLTDDRDAKLAATQLCGIAASGTIGVLYQAAKDRSIPFAAADFDRAIDNLLRTNFRHSADLLHSIHELSLTLHRLENGSPAP